MSMPILDPSLCIRCGQCAKVCPMGVLKLEEDACQVNPKRRCIGCMHCAAVCPRQAVGFEGLDHDQLYQKTPDSELLRLVKTRRSVRSYTDTPPSSALLQWALDQTAYAPSGKNVHANGWTILYGKSHTDRITQLILDNCRATGSAPELPKLAERGTNLITCGAPCVIVSWSPDDALNPVLDNAVAMTTLELLLCSRGVSTCWGGYLCQEVNKFPHLLAELGVPDGCHVRCALMAGYARGETYRCVPYRPAVQANWIGRTEDDG